ncbi:hypothetical protein [Streptomyces sp. NPDC058758]|uniref:hypothetical protein n=1 Tax=Streptomyces sp. NPDC058758 TaxID=3346627 RepID=UPI003680EC25
MPGLLLLADRETTDYPTPHGPVRLRKYAGAPGREFVRAAVRAGNGERAALVTLRPAAYGHVEAWLAALAAHAPAAADHRRPGMAPASVRLLARMTRTHANGVPRQSDGSVGWGVPGASARVWPDGRIAVTSDAGVELSARLEGAQWDDWRVAGVVDAGLRLLCAPAARHLTRTSGPKGWVQSSLWAGRSYDASASATCTCGWRGTYGSRMAALAAAQEHRGNSGLFGGA